MKRKMKGKWNWCGVFLLLCWLGNAQKAYTLKGNFKEAKNAKIDLVGFKTLKDTVISSSSCDSEGNFKVSYPAVYSGAAVLKVNPGTQGEYSLIVLLNKENFAMRWEDSKDFSTLHFENSPENDAFGKGITIAQQAEAKLAGLNYLKPLYEKSPDQLKWVENEKAAEEKAFLQFCDALPANSYAKYYLGIRKLVQDFPLTANRYGERMPENEKQFKAIDFSDPRLLQSGMLQELLNGFYQLMESHGDLNNVTEHANAATDALLKSLNNAPALKKEIAAYLFKQLEKRSLFQAAEHLALSMLTEGSCSLDNKSAAMYEQYRAMGVGKTAPALVLAAQNDKPSGLSDISARYKLIVFGSSWCPKCQQEMQEFKKFYPQWKEKYQLEIVFVSLDTDKAQYNAFVKDFPWISSCDFKGWESKSVVDYFVFATPTMYLLDSENKILLKPFSAAQTDTWLIGR